MSEQSIAFGMTVPLTNLYIATSTSLAEEAVPWRHGSSPIVNRYRRLMNVVSAGIDPDMTIAIAEAASIANGILMMIESRISLIQSIMNKAVDPGSHIMSHSEDAVVINALVEVESLALVLESGSRDWTSYDWAITDPNVVTIAYHGFRARDVVTVFLMDLTLLIDGAASLAPVRISGAIQAAVDGFLQRWADEDGGEAWQR